MGPLSASSALAVQEQHPTSNPAEPESDASDHQTTSTQSQQTALARNGSSGTLREAVPDAELYAMSAREPRLAARTSSLGSLSLDNGSEGQGVRRHSTTDKYLNSTPTLSHLQMALESIMLTDKGLYDRLQAGLRGIGSLARETNQLSLMTDETGATVINQYVVVKTLGRGSFGKVKLCMDTVNGQLFAIKMINRNYLVKTLQRPKPSLRKRSGRGLGEGASFRRASADTSSASEEVSREIAIMKKMDHPNIVKLHEVIDPPGSQYIMLVMEYMEKGPVLQTRGQGGYDVFPEEVAADYFRQACNGLEYLHYNHVVHADLKPENLLVSASGELKISDFGSSRVLDGKASQKRMMGTPAFQPPELVGGPVPLEDPFTPDVWALGVCLFCFVFGCLPFQGASMRDVYAAIASEEPAYPPERVISPALRDLLGRMLQKDPHARIKLPDMMEHPWVTDGGALKLVSLRALTAPPRVIEVTRQEAQNAIERTSLVSLIRARLKEKTLRPGEYLFRQGQPATCVYFIMSGAVELLEGAPREPTVPTVEEDNAEEEHSFTIDIDESFLLENAANVAAQAAAMSGRLHIDRKKARDLRQRRKSWLMENNADIVVGLKGPGQVVGEVALELPPPACALSARAREEVVALKLTQDSYMRALAAMVLDGDSGIGASGDNVVSAPASLELPGDGHSTISSAEGDFVSSWSVARSVTS